MVAYEFEYRYRSKRVFFFASSPAKNFLLEEQYGERYRAYQECVPRLLPSLRSRVVADGQLPRWRGALWDQAFQCDNCFSGWAKSCQPDLDSLKASRVFLKTWHLCFWEAGAERFLDQLSAGS